MGYCIKRARPKAAFKSTQFGQFQSNPGPFQSNPGPFQSNPAPFQSNPGPFQSNPGKFEPLARFGWCL